MIARRLLHSLRSACYWLLDVVAGWLAVACGVAALALGAFALGLSFVVPGCPWSLRLLFVAVMPLGGGMAAMCYEGSVRGCPSMSPRWKRVSRYIWHIQGSMRSGSVEDRGRSRWAWETWENRDGTLTGAGWTPTLLLAQLAAEEYVFGRRLP